MSVYTRVRSLTGFIVAASATIALVLMVNLTLSYAQPTKDTRIVLCHGIIDNDANAARLQADVLRLCGDVGVYP